MSSEPAGDPKAAEALSALMDGEVPEGAEVGQACRGWRDDAALRASWHCYHLIGDVLRSDDLASSAARDAAFLSRLRSRLEAEPVVLAPTPRPVVVRTRRWRWAAPAAVAAGFVAVAGVLVVTRSPVAPPASGPGLAAATSPAPARPADAAVVPVANQAVEPEVAVANGKMIRDARLDRYLDAHQQFGNTTALGTVVPLHRATLDLSQR